MKKIQLAKLYRGSRFYGYGLAVDGELLHNQIGNHCVAHIIQVQSNE